MIVKLQNFQSEQAARNWMKKNQPRYDNKLLFGYTISSEGDYVVYYDKPEDNN